MAEENVYSYLDQYCERAGEPGLWAEPLNAVTNLAFLLAAFMAWNHWRRTPGATFRNSIDIVLLILFLVAIGIGSGLWHLFATEGTMMLDVIPIVLFMNLFLLAAAVRLLGLHWRGALGLFILFQGLNYAAGKFLPSGFLNGTIMYLPAYAVLLTVVVWAHKRRVPSRGLLWQAVLLWSISLTCRTFDNQLCVQLPIGLHFLWHLFNAAVLYRLLQSLIVVQAVKKD